MKFYWDATSGVYGCAFGDPLEEIPIRNLEFMLRTGGPIVSVDVERLAEYHRVGDRSFDVFIRPENVEYNFAFAEHTGERAAKQPHGTEDPVSMLFIDRYVHHLMAASPPGKRSRGRNAGGSTAAAAPERAPSRELAADARPWEDEVEVEEPEATPAWKLDGQLEQPVQSSVDRAAALIGENSARFLDTMRRAAEEAEPRLVQFGKTSLPDLYEPSMRHQPQLRRRNRKFPVRTSEAPAAAAQAAWAGCLRQLAVDW